MQNSLGERIQSSTPKFFKKLRNIGLALAAIATTIVTAPVALPGLIIKIAGYFAVAGAVAGAVGEFRCTGERNVFSLPRRRCI